jgi:dihydropteroate synthase
MGVLNVTPDSFSDPGRFLDPKTAVAHGLEMARQGADWIDVGGESTRPGSKPISEDEELGRVLPVIERLGRALTRQTGRRRHGAVSISIDTTKSRVAESAIRAGARMINDVSGLRFDLGLAGVAARYRTPLVLMHLRGRPETMQRAPFARSIWRSLEAGLGASVRRAVTAGVPRSQLIIDPGLGFGKTRRQNYEILNDLHRLQHFRLPIVVGTSRKSFVQAIVAGDDLVPVKAVRGARQRGPWTLTGGAPDEQVLRDLAVGDAAAVTAAILAGAHIVRVHDVAAVLPAIRIADAVLAASSAGRKRR